MSVIRASDYRTPEANRISSFSSPSGSRPSNALEAWNGYAFDRPGSKRWESVYPGAALEQRELLWARLLSQLAKRPSLPGLSYECDRSALGDARNCGRGSGLVRACEEGGHRYFTPLGCGTPWCLRCTGMAADLRAMKVHRDLRELSSLASDLAGVRPPVLRLTLTLDTESKRRVIEAGRDGANSLIQAGRRAIVAAAGSTGSMPLMITLHPTSSKRPWIRSPHLHAVALWGDMDAEGVLPLAWSAPARPIDADALRESWAEEYPGSKVIRAAYYTHGPIPSRSNDTPIDQGGCYTRPSRGGRQTLGSALRSATVPGRRVRGRVRATPGYSWQHYGRTPQPLASSDAALRGRGSRCRSSRPPAGAGRRPDVAAVPSRATIRRPRLSRIRRQDGGAASPRRDRARRALSSVRLSRLRLDAVRRDERG